MKGERTRSTDRETWIWVCVCFLVGLAHLIDSAGCSTPVKSIEGAVSVDATKCKEDPSLLSASDASFSQVSLDCLSGGVAVKITLSRLAWEAIQSETDPPGPFEAGPGK